MNQEVKKESFNLKCENFKQQLVNIINNSELPISSVYYIFQLLYKDIEETYYNILKMESNKNREEKIVEGEKDSE